MEVDGQRLDNDTVSRLCEPCQEGNVSTQADGYCNDCEEYMCQTCFQSHLKLKLGRNHVLGALGGGSRQISQKPDTKCKKHTTESIKYYCRNHDSVGCGHCLVFDHRKCEPEVIEDLAKNLKESSDFKNILKEIEELESLKTEIEVSLEKNRNDNTEMHDKAIHEIQKQRAEINTWLDKITSKMEAEEMEIWKENEIALSKLEDWIKIISDMIDKVEDKISVEKYTGENLFIRMIECKSEVSEFVTRSVPEIKSNLDIKPFAFEPNKKLCVITKLANLGLIRLGNGTTELQIDKRERLSDVTCIDGASSVVSSNITGPEAEDFEICESGTLKRSEAMRAELEKELERIRENTLLEKKQRENLEKTCTTLKTELEDNVVLLSREREERQKCINKTNKLEQTIIVLKKENSSFNDLNISLKSQLDSCKKEFETFKSNYKARQDQDHNKIESLQSKLKTISESHEKERESLSSQIRDLQRPRESAQMTYQEPDPRAAGFDVGKRVEYKGPNLILLKKGTTGTVTAVDPSGFINAKWDNGRSRRCTAGAGGLYQVKLL